MEMSQSAWLQSGMQSPNCQHCETGKYLKFLSYEEGYTEQVPFSTAHGTIYRTRETLPVVEYFCQSCGGYNGHSVPNWWFPPEDTGTPAELKERGDYWSDPHTHWVRREDGSWAGRS